MTDEPTDHELLLRRRCGCRLVFIPYLIVITCLLLFLTACGATDVGDRQYYEHPKDTEVQQHVFLACLAETRPPGATHYNDQDEAIEACDRVADDLARYCPDGADDCLPQYDRSRADVRTILKENTDESD